VLAPLPAYLACIATEMASSHAGGSDDNESMLAELKALESEYALSDEVLRSLQAECASNAKQLETLQREAEDNEQLASDLSDIKKIIEDERIHQLEKLEVNKVDWPIFSFLIVESLVVVNSIIK
jgi:predicted nuclease with TOPRIM domain